jgi:hypothetical protein
MASDTSSPQQLSGLDRFFVENFILAIVLSVCCNVVGLVLSVLGVLTCKDPKAKSNALICLIVWAVLHVAVIGGRFAIR